MAGLLATARAAPHPGWLERVRRLDELRAAGLVRAASEPAPTERVPMGRASTERASAERASTERASAERASTERASVERVRRLDELRAAGLVRAASEPAGVGVDRVLPVNAALRPLLPGGGLRRGGTVALSGAVSTVGRVSSVGTVTSDALASGSTSLLFALLAEASAAGSWCAVVGLPRLGLVAAAEAGVVIDRLALVPNPGPEWGAVVAALLDGVDIVVTGTPGAVSAAVTGRLAARARQRGAVLIPVGARAQWPGADLTLEVVRGAWHGLAQGRGRLRRYEAEVLAYGRGAAARPRRAQLWLAGMSSATAVKEVADLAARRLPEPGLRLAG
jgi:hypothetical protein